MAIDTDPRGQPRTTSVLLVDDHGVVRSGLRAFIEKEEDFVVAGEAGTAEEAIDLVASVHPDLVMMDVRLPGRSGISACQEITTRFPDVKVLILTSYADEIALSSAVLAGASGFLLKNVVVTGLVDDIRRVANGESLFDVGVSSPTPEPSRRLAALSPQERILADLLADGLTNRQIAKRMSLSEKTIKNYVSHVLTKLGMTRRSEAAAFMARVHAMTGAPVPGGSARWDDA